MSTRVHNRILGTVVHTLVWLTVLSCASCRRGPATPPVRSAYYWSTTWEGDSTTLCFIRDEGISRLYLRLFDVVVDERNEVMPNATIRIAGPMPDSVEVIPTVFIVNDCMARPTQRLDSLLLRRILQMAETHDLGPIRELQIDCDWTKGTQKAYFAMLSRLREGAHQHGIQLSATIRLHQLQKPVPPVDKGVLMMYNTGSITQRHRNPILDMDDVGPYMPHIRGYALPLSTAYPVYAWQLLFRGDHFIGIIHDDDDLRILPGDTIIHREATPATVMQARDAIGRQRPDANHEIILYDISPKNIQRIKQYHYEKIYSH